MSIAPPVVHDLQFGTYSSPHRARGRHSSWPCMCGLTRSHGRRAGAWVRLGDKSYWCCLQRARRLTRVERSVRVKAPSTGVTCRLPAGTPPVYDEERPILRRALDAAGLIVVVVLLVLAVVSAVGVFA